MTVARHSRRRMRRRWRLSALSVVIALVCAAGVGVALYPATARWFSASQQAEQVRQYGAEVTTIGPAGRKKALEQAEAYNAALDAGAEVKADARVPVDTGATLPAGFDYDSMLAVNARGLMGRIIIPAIGVDLPIYHGTSDATLVERIGHLEGTALPIGGDGAHAVLAGHRGLASSRLFTDLDRVRTGDTFTIAVFGATLEYEVTSVRIVEPDQTRSLRPVAGKDLVTLVTCTPLGINTQRILVTGTRVHPTSEQADAAAGAAPVDAGFPWWAAGFGAAACGIGAYVWWAGRAPAARAPAALTPRPAQPPRRGPLHKAVQGSRSHGTADA